MCTCGHALALLLCREDLSVLQSAENDVPDPKAEDRVGEKELGHSCETRPPFVQILSQLYHVQNLRGRTPA